MTLTLISRKTGEETNISPFYVSPDPKPADTEEYRVKPGSQIMEIDFRRVYEWDGKEWGYKRSIED